MKLTVYLAGEIHTNWRDQIKDLCNSKNLNIDFLEPVTEHELSDDCGAIIMGTEEKKFWHDNKGAKLNSIRTRISIERADVVVIRFGEKYKQWNAAFDAGYALASGKSIIIMHGPEHQHALKEIDAAALAVAETTEQIVKIIEYTMKGSLS